ncbi:MAG: hypothetical protein ACLPN5_03640 [Roseiarcus sp.]
MTLHIQIIFSGRALHNIGNLWLPIARRIAESRGVDITMEYFLTSRVARVKPSEDYLQYARRAITPDAIVVDVCGAGWSLAHLFERIGRRGQTIAFLQKLPARADYEAIARTPAGANLVELLADVEGCNNTGIEMCNYATHGMVLDVRLALDAAIAIFAEDQRSERVKQGVEAQQAAARLYVQALARSGLVETIGFDDPSLARVGGALYHALAHDAAVYANYLEEHMAEDQATLRRLAAD